MGFNPLGMLGSGIKGMTGIDMNTVPLVGGLFPNEAAKAHEAQFAQTAAQIAGSSMLL